MSSNGSISRSELFDLCAKDNHSQGCVISNSFYGYRLSIAANAAFLGIFSLLLAAYIITYAITRRGLGFTIALALGLICEILGYAGRVMSWGNQWTENGFFMQICCLTIAPAFMAAGIYLCLRRIVYAFGPENSRIKPEYYTRIFIPCDILSLVLQAAGGAMAASSFHSDASVSAGDDIMLAGLSFQVVTLLVFAGVSADFARRAAARRRLLGAAAAFDQGAAASRVRGSPAFRGCLGALALATVCVFVRSVYRVAELSKGWTGPLMRRQGLFVGFEGVMIVAACAALLVFHPSVCFGDMMQGPGGLGVFGRRRVEGRADLEGEEEKCESPSDTSDAASQGEDDVGDSKRERS